MLFRSLYKVSDHEIIQGHGKCQEKTRQDPRHQIRKSGLVKSIKGSGTQIQCCLIGITAGLSKLRHDAQDRIGNIKGDVSDEYGPEDVYKRQGQDGPAYNFSWNCGVEGPSRKKKVQELRLQQMKNAFLLLLFSQGTPMILAGDEFGNSPRGNNNPYCQDNEISWLESVSYTHLDVYKRQK